MAFSLDTTRSALLLMDFQNGIVENYAAKHPAVLERAAQALAAARKAGLRVLHVVIGFREGYPEVSPNNKSFSTIRQNGRFAAGSPSAAIHAPLAPLAGELVVTKHRVSAFSGSDLDMLLRAGGIDTLVLAGIATSGVVLSTLRQAADLDFKIAVLADACLDADPAVHACLVEKVFPRQADILDVAAMEQALTGD